MEFSGLDLCLLMMLSGIVVEGALNPEGENVCLKTINYTKSTTLPDFGFKKPINRNKIVIACCAGYEEASDESKCLPVCLKGCGNGKCVAPGNCSCDSGFYGLQCDKICDENKYGENCVHKCQCSENEICDRFSGCTCKPGWTGNNCTTPCPKGYYGNLCMEKCICDDYLCDHITGECITSGEPLIIHTTEGAEAKEETTLNFSNDNDVTSTMNGVKNDILEELITNISSEEKISRSENQMFNPISDSHTTENETAQSSRAGNFIPTFTVLSSVSLLILFIGGKWLFVIFRNYFDKMTNGRLHRFDEELIMLPDSRFLSGNFEDAIIYTSDIKDNPTPALYSFKPPAPQNEKNFKEKTHNLIPA